MRLVLYGLPVGHSLSPALFSFLGDKLGVDADYHACEIETASDFELAFKSSYRNGIRGANVTMPYKRNAFSLADEADALAKAAKSANTLVFESDKVFAYNTDIMAMKEHFSRSEWHPRGRLLILGAGGASRAALVAAKQYGFKRIYLWNRSTEGAKRVAADIPVRIYKGKLRKHFDYVISSLPPVEPPKFLSSCIDTRSEGFDFVYAEETPFVLLLKSKDIRVTNGLRFLFDQGVSSFEYFYQTEVPKDTRDALFAEFREKINE